MFRFLTENTVLANPIFIFLSSLREKLFQTMGHSLHHMIMPSLFLVISSPKNILKYILPKGGLPAVWCGRPLPVSSWDTLRLYSFDCVIPSTDKFKKLTIYKHQ